jgi:uncharacterized circularly permuted ATP-grasp superfamily protein
LYGEIQMATTTFSGPVVSTNGFVADAQTGLAALLADEDNALNTTNKTAGLQAVDLSTGLVYTATGSGVNDTWVISNAATAITPA